MPLTIKNCQKPKGWCIKKWALMYAIEEASDDDNGRDKKIYKKNEGAKKDL